ncbi:MAG TPA: AI-2E family transporter [Firmicutes bacterium]|nr:AI-2E family transporter [Bacillota bacterium]
MKLTFKNCAMVVLTLFALYLLTYYWSGVSSFALALAASAASLILGAVIAYVVNIPMSCYERFLGALLDKPAMHRPVRALSMLLAIASVLAIAFFVVQLVVPELYRCVLVLIQEIPSYIKPAWDYLNQNFDIEALLQSAGAGVMPDILGEDVNWQELASRIVTFLITGLGGVTSALLAFINASFSVIVSLILGIIFSVYLLMGKERIGSQITRVMDAYLSKRVTGRVFHILDVLNDSFHRFIVGQCTEAIILGVLCTLGMSLLKFPYAAMTGALIGFTALIPIAGAYIGAGVGAFMIFTEDPIKALLFLVFIVLLQQFEGNVIYPKVVGASIGLPGIWVLTAVTIGGGLAGIPGMLIAVPLFAALYRLLGDSVRRREALAAAGSSPAPPDIKTEKKE